MAAPTPTSVGTAKQSIPPVGGLARYGTTPARQRRYGSKTTSADPNNRAFNLGAGPGADTMTVAQPTHLGDVLLVNVNKDDSAITLTITFTGNVWFGGAAGAWVATVTLSGAGSFIYLISVLKDDALYWAEVSSGNAATP